MKWAISVARRKAHPCHRNRRTLEVLGKGPKLKVVAGMGVNQSVTFAPLGGQLYKFLNQCAFPSRRAIEAERGRTQKRIEPRRHRGTRESECGGRVRD